MNTSDTSCSNNLRLHNQQIIEVARTPLNLWGTGEEFKHSPNLDVVQGRNEVVEQFIHSGAIEQLQAEHGLVPA